MIGRAVLSAIDDDTKAQSLKLVTLADEAREDVERFQEYGFTSVPEADAEAVVLYVGGNRAHPLVVATEDRRYRPTGLATGEVAIYTSTDGIRFHAKANGHVLIGTDADLLAAVADYVDDRLATIQTTFDGHTHNTTATIGPSAAVGVISPPLSAIGSLQSVACAEVYIT